VVFLLQNFINVFCNRAYDKKENNFICGKHLTTKKESELQK
jgi:hypothetical protein